MEDQYKEMEINKHNFEESKNRLKEFSEQIQKDLNLKKVEEKGELFGIKIDLLDRNVTGKELNELTSQIQEYLIESNNDHIKIRKEFGEIYNTFESLDRDYMNKICLSIRGLEEINRKISKNIEDIEKLLNNQKLTLEAILKFKK